MDNSIYQNSDNSIYRSNLLTNTKGSMHWPNNFSNQCSSQSIETRFDCPNYNSYNDPLMCSQSGTSKHIPPLNQMCDKFQDSVPGSYSRYSLLNSSNHMRIWTDIEQSKPSDATSWGIMFPMQVTSNSNERVNWDCDIIKNSVVKDIGLPRGNGNKLTQQQQFDSPREYYSPFSSGTSLSLQNLEKTLSSLNMSDNRYSYASHGSDNDPSPCKKTWALIVGRQGKDSTTPFSTVSALNNNRLESVVSEATPVGIISRQLDISSKKARFFVIKSYSEDDVYRSIKYEIWCSTENGNRKLDSAYLQSGGKMHIYLFFSVNGSGHFCGVAEMIGPVDYKAQAGVWAQGKWKGQFPVRWVLVKDIPNSQLRHIRIETNENKPVTNSRDVTEIPLERGRQVLKIFASFKASSSIYDDFGHYEQRELSESNS